MSRRHDSFRWWVLVGALLALVCAWSAPVQAAGSTTADPAEDPGVARAGRSVPPAHPAPLTPAASSPKQAPPGSGTRLHAASPPADPGQSASTPARVPHTGASGTDRAPSPRTSPARHPARPAEPGPAVPWSYGVPATHEPAQPDHALWSDLLGESD